MMLTFSLNKEYFLNIHLMKYVKSIILIFSLFVPFTTQAEGPTPTPINLVDRNGVNLATGQVTTSLQTVSIAGLSHSLSSHTNNFSLTGYYGYVDKYAGSVKTLYLGKNHSFNGVSYPIHIARASGPEGSQDFKILTSGNSYSYEALGDSYQEGDTRHTLEISADQLYLIWTTDNGTKLRYKRTTNPTFHSSAYLREIIYPDGLTYNIHVNTGVTTNTGLQLKYDFVDDNRPLDTGKAHLLANLPSYSYVHYLNNSSGDWYDRNPKYIRGINNAIDYCDPTIKAPCSLSQDWPTATFSWPAGMPAAINLGKSIFSVKDMRGGITDYHFEAHDLAFVDSSDFLTEWPYPPSVRYGQFKRPGEKFSPRLAAIKPAGSDDIQYTYNYINDYRFESSSSGRNVGLELSYSWWELTTDSGELVSSTGPKGTSNYTIGQSLGQGDDYRNDGSSSWAKISSDNLGRIREFDQWNFGYVYYENDFRNFIKYTRLDGEPYTQYFYDDRGNLERIVKPHGTVTAYYPTTCSNRKTCNQPIWVKDERGYQTDYEYHAASGLLSKITKPANEQGIRPQTRYFYEQKYARYKNASGNVVQAPTPIWKLIKESTCSQGSFSGNGCASSQYEVVTTYDYGSGSSANNLWLKGTVVSTNGKSLRTCFQYDIYGNQIGQTQPNANLTSCQ